MTQISDLDRDFSDYIDEVHGMVKIGPASWFASDVWEAMDPRGYAMARLEYARERRSKKEEEDG